jgi:hypothetical protein
MGEITGLGMNDHVQHHDDTVDHVAGQFSRIMAQVLQFMIAGARRAIEQRRLAVEQAILAGQERERAEREAQDAQRQAVEKRLAAMEKRGWDRASRTEIADAVRDAAEWAGDSDAARRAMVRLAVHVRTRWGLHVDALSGHVTLDSPDAPDLAAQLARVEHDRLGDARAQTAQDRMVALVAGHDGLDESSKAQLYADISEWQRNPGQRSLDALTQKLTAAGLDEKTRTRIRFVALYLGGAGQTEVPVGELGVGSAASPLAELRKLGEPLVDPGEEVKARMDEMLVRYQDRLRHGVDPRTVTDQLAEAVAVLTPEDQELARERGKAIRTDPGAERTPLWPGYVDRGQLGEQIRMYAMVTPQVEARLAADSGALDADWSAAQRKRMDRLRGDIDTAVTSGKGLHEWERDQIRHVLAEVEAGKTTAADMLFVDDRTAAGLDRERSDTIAAGVGRQHRRELEQLLPPGAVRVAREEITQVTSMQTALASGRVTLPEFEEAQAEERLLARLKAAGAPEPLVNRARNGLDGHRESAAITGKQARRLADKWVERRDTVVAARRPETPAYDSPEHREQRRNGLVSAGLGEDEIAQHVAAAAGTARPAAAAVKNAPSHNGKGRATGQGAGMHRINHRGRGKGRDGYSR